MLGAFQLTIDGEPVKEWNSVRGLAVFKYLLAGHGRVVPREVLMETFWPGADPEAARNNLNVALHSLRQALRSITLLPVVLFDNGKYSLNPDLQVWVDVEEFEQHLKAGQILERVGKVADAIREYEAATSLYEGDLLADDPYEEWPVFEREHLRISYLDMLDRLSQIYFNQEQYLACIALCRRILERDNCREDAHRCLMRCYSRQGQRHLALRQYLSCVEALRAELDVDPEPTTTQLVERIRLRQLV
jgi:DNA-binding SARP family transcriptional activator